MVESEGAGNIAKHADHKVIELAKTWQWFSRTKYCSITVTQQLVLKVKINKYAVLLWNRIHQIHGQQKKSTSGKTLF